MDAKRTPRAEAGPMDIPGYVDRPTASMPGADPNDISITGRTPRGEGRAWERPPAYDCDHASLDGLAGTDLLVCMACFRLVRTVSEGQLTRYVALDDEPIKAVFSEVEKLREWARAAFNLINRIDPTTAQDANDQAGLLTAHRRIEDEHGR